MIIAVLVIVALKAASGKVAAIAAAQESVLNQLAPTEYDLVAQWRNIPAFAAEIDRDAIRRIESDPMVLRIDPDVGGSGTLAQSVPLIGADKVHILISSDASSTSTATAGTATARAAVRMGRPRSRKPEPRPTTMAMEAMSQASSARAELSRQLAWPLA